MTEINEEYVLLDEAPQKLTDIKPLWNHQIESIERFKDAEYGALFHDPGVGKTRTTIEILRHKYNKGRRVLSTLILAPVIVLENWKDEFQKFSKIPDSQIVVLNGPTVRRKELFKIKRERLGSELIVITNYEGVVASPDFYKDLYEWHPDIVVADESHRLKQYNSKRAKIAVKIADRAKYKYILTGTPVLNSPLDLFSQFRFLDNGRTFGTNYFIFRSTYFYDKNAGMPKGKYFPNWVIRPGSVELMNKKVLSKATRVLKHECLDLPPLIKQRVYVELSPKQKEVYNSMKRDLIAFLNGEAITAQLAITKALRLQQIVTGYVKTEEGKEITIKDTPRIAALSELLEQIARANKVLVWCVFKENYRQVKEVCEKLKLKYVEAHGEISDSKKFESVSNFNNDPTIRVFIGHPGSLGLGVNICAASYSIYYSRSFSLEHDIQSQARNYRGGSEVHEKITRIDLIAKGTIDELVLEALEKKEAISIKLLQQFQYKF